MATLRERLLAHYRLSEEDYALSSREPSFSSIPFIDSDPNVAKAVVRLRHGVAGNEKIIVYGDYDTDGVMATSIMVKAFENIGFPVSGYLPSRYLDGYGLSVANVDKIASAGYSLIVCVDNGISARPALEEAAAKGIDVIIVDHHEHEGDLPPAFAIIHPLTIKYGAIPTSAGYLAFLLSHALLGETDEYLATLAAVSTISDMMPMQGYNRELVRLGLASLAKNKYPSLCLLSEKKAIDETVLGFDVIPKINAVGRMVKDASINRLVRYFSADDPRSVSPIAAWLIAVNEERRTATKKAAAEVRVEPDEAAIVVRADIPEGLNGLLANRLLQEYERPVCVFSKSENEEGVLVGSLRSKEGFNVMKALSSLDKYLLAGGGHAFAGGLSIKESAFPSFKKDMIFLALKYRLSALKKDLIPLETNETTMDSYRLIRTFGPFGMGNPEPEFLLKGIKADELTYISSGKYLSTKLPGGARLFSFSISEDSFERGSLIDLSVRFSLNEYKGRLSLDLLAEKAQ